MSDAERSSPDRPDRRGRGPRGGAGEPERASPDAASPDPAVAPLPARVLVVDDEPVVCNLLGSVLALPAFTVTTFGTAEDALGAFDADAYDVALVDKNLPGQSGLALLSALRARDAQLPVLLMTGYASMETAIEALRRGAYDYIEKPFADIDLVVRKVTQALEHHRLSKQNRALVDDLLRANRRLTERNVELLETQEELVRQLRLATAGQLVALAGAELSDPLTGLKSDLHVLADELGPVLAHVADHGTPSQPDGRAFGAEVRRTLVDMKSSLERLSSMVRALQVFASAGRTEARSFDVHSSIDRALELFEHERRRHGVVVRLDIAEPRPRVRGIPLLVAQALFHILQNALEAIALSPRSGDGLIELRARVADGALQLIITDNGTGISAADLRQVQRAFFTTKEADRHAGLGLSLASEIARRHGGRLRLDSDLGLGTRVTMTLPLA